MKIYQSFFLLLLCQKLAYSFLQGQSCFRVPLFVNFEVLILSSRSVFWIVSRV